jgi:hypothetical protein
MIFLSCPSAFAQQENQPDDSLPRPIPDFLSPELFIPKSRLLGFQLWTFAPLPRPVIYVLPTFGFDGSIGFGEYAIDHPEKFFSTLEGYNEINVPQLYLTEQMMIGNTLKLGKKIYFMSGILYGAQLGIMGNNWGMGTREGLIIHPSSLITITIWNQYFQSVSVYSPVLYPRPSEDAAAIRMPATPEVFSFGVQATFVVGEFVIDVGASVSPVPYQKRQHSEFRYK